MANWGGPRKGAGRPSSMEDLKLFAVTVVLDRRFSSKSDFEECWLMYARTSEEALSKAKVGRCEEEYLDGEELMLDKYDTKSFVQGYYRFEVLEVDLERLKRGEVEWVYGRYHN